MVEIIFSVINVSFGRYRLHITRDFIDDSCSKRGMNEAVCSLKGLIIAPDNNRY